MNNQPPVQIMFISNGVLVTTVPAPSQLNPQPQPITKFCKDYAETCVAIRSIWPVNIVE